MNRNAKLLVNSISSIVYQIVAIICGFVLPRFLLTYYGSEVNGVVSSITQFLGFISLAECGVGAVIQSTLYKPLAKNDMETISKIVVSSERFFKRIAYILLGYTVFLMVVYPLLTIDSFDYLFTLTLIFVISISTFAQYYLGMTYKLVLAADQLGFIQYTIHAFALVLNTGFCVVLMKWGATIHVVKLMTTAIFIMQPILLSIIAKKRYNFNYEVLLTEEPIKQKWNGLAQHIAGVVLINTDTVVLTLFSTLENVSVYTVYYMVVNGVRQIILSATNGIRAMFGNMLANNERDVLKRSFGRTEWFIHGLVTFVFSVTFLCIIPFVRVYTYNVTDTNYIVPSFAYMITLAQATCCYRLPYYILVNAAGHYKHTQKSAIIEAIINVVVSIILVFPLGLFGVAVGTFAAMVYRTIYLVRYLRDNILHRPIKHFVKQLFIDVCEVVLIYFVVRSFPAFFAMEQVNYSEWIVLAIKLALTVGLILLFVNALFYKDQIKQFIRGRIK